MSTLKEVHDTSLEARDGVEHDRVGMNFDKQLEEADGEKEQDRGEGEQADEVSETGMKLDKQLEEVDGEEEQDRGEGEQSDELCGICLEDTAMAQQRGFLDSCTHFFCFPCIFKWSQVESKCPLCKSRFTRLRRVPVPRADVITQGESTGEAAVSLQKPTAPKRSLRSTTVHVPLKDQQYTPQVNDAMEAAALAAAGVGAEFLDAYANTGCAECGEVENEHLMLLCDRCDGASHTYCVGLGVEVPSGQWMCRQCTGQQQRPARPWAYRRRSSNLLQQVRASINQSRASMGSQRSSITRLMHRLVPSAADGGILASLLEGEEAQDEQQSHRRFRRRGAEQQEGDVEDTESDDSTDEEDEWEEETDGEEREWEEEEEEEDDDTHWGMIQDKDGSGSQRGIQSSARILRPRTSGQQAPSTFARTAAPARRKKRRKYRRCKRKGSRRRRRAAASSGERSRASPMASTYLAQHSSVCAETAVAAPVSNRGQSTVAKVEDDFTFTLRQLRCQVAPATSSRTVFSQRTTGSSSAPVPALWPWLNTNSRDLHVTAATGRSPTLAVPGNSTIGSSRHGQAVPSTSELPQRRTILCDDPLSGLGSGSSSKTSLPKAPGRLGLDSNAQGLHRKQGQSARGLDGSDNAVAAAWQLADRLLASDAVSGNFSAAGNRFAIGQGQSQPVVDEGRRQKEQLQKRMKPMLIVPHAPVLLDWGPTPSESREMVVRDETMARAPKPAISPKGLCAPQVLSGDERLKEAPVTAWVERIKQQDSRESADTTAGKGREVGSSALGKRRASELQPEEVGVEATGSISQYEDNRRGQQVDSWAFHYQMESVRQEKRKRWEQQTSCRDNRARESPVMQILSCATGSSQLRTFKGLCFERQTNDSLEGSARDEEPCEGNVTEEMNGEDVQLNSGREELTLKDRSRAGEAKSKLEIDIPIATFPTSHQKVNLGDSSKDDVTRSTELDGRQKIVESEGASHMVEHHQGESKSREQGHLLKTAKDAVDLHQHSSMTSADLALARMPQNPKKLKSSRSPLLPDQQAFESAQGTSAEEKKHEATSAATMKVLREKKEAIAKAFKERLHLLYRQGEIDKDEFKDMARSATHSLMEKCGTAKSHLLCGQLTLSCSSGLEVSKEVSDGQVALTRNEVQEKAANQPSVCPFCVNELLSQACQKSSKAKR